MFDLHTYTNPVIQTVLKSLNQHGSWIAYPVTMAVSILLFKIKELKQKELQKLQQPRAIAIAVGSSCEIWKHSQDLTGILLTPFLPRHNFLTLFLLNISSFSLPLFHFFMQNLYIAGRVLTNKRNLHFIYKVYFEAYLLIS